MVGAQHIEERQGCIQKVPNRHSRMLSEKRPLRGDAVHTGCRSRCSKFGACELRGGEYLDPPSAQCPFPTRRQGWGLQRTPRDSPLTPESRVWCSYWHPSFPIGRPWLDQNAPHPWPQWSGQQWAPYPVRAWEQGDVLFGVSRNSARHPCPWTWLGRRVRLGAVITLWQQRWKLEDRATSEETKPWQAQVTTSHWAAPGSSCT